MSKQTCSIEQNEVLSTIRKMIDKHNEKQTNEFRAFKNFNGKSIQALFDLYYASNELLQLQGVSYWIQQLSETFRYAVLYDMNGSENEPNETATNNRLFNMQMLLCAIADFNVALRMFSDTTGVFLPH